jgi:hypothetical protein
VRSRLVVVGLLPLVLAACGAAHRAATPAKPAAPANVPSTKALTIKVTSVVKSSRSHRRSATVTTPGDRVDFVDVLLNTAPRFGKGSNEQIGSDKGTMTFTSSTTATMKGIATLPDGTIHFEGDVTVLPNNRVTVPVIGGTGSYAHASGTLLVGSGAARATNTYTLVISSIQGPIA